MHLTFLGTSAGAPTRERNVTAQLLTFDDGRLWLLDCGEATQHQLQHAGVRAARLECILLTHLHGDHCLGLPGLLASLAIHGRTEAVTVIGPQGVREFVETTLRLTATVLSYALEVVELAPEATAALGTRDGWLLTAVPIRHRVPCFAYVLRELPRPGRFHPDRAHALGVPEGRAFGLLQHGTPYVRADGRTIRPEEVLDPPRPGRLIALLGDTEDATSLLGHADHCDLLVCETTYDATRDEKARQWGHSSTRMTGALAQRLHARTLVITHFSSRYTEPGSSRDDPVLSTDDLVAETQAACPGTRVVAASDLWSLPIPAQEA